MKFNIFRIHNAMHNNQYLFIKQAMARQVCPLMVLINMAKKGRLVGVV